MLSIYGIVKHKEIPDTKVTLLFWQGHCIPTKYMHPSFFALILKEVPIEFEKPRD